MSIEIELENLSDMDLVLKSVSGDQAAFSIIVQRHKSKIASTVFGMLGESMEAEDIGHEVFIRFYNSMGNFKGESALSTYLTRIAINLSLNELKRRKKNIFKSFFNLTPAEIFNDISRKSMNDYEAKEVVDKCISQLSPKLRSVVILRLMDQYSTEETAEILNVPVGTVLSRLARGQKILKELLTPYRYDK
ncbi:MAG: RNA polymerase sigma factor [Ignavibacteriaceae bacterium]|nr:RNA polymerase sigma factor [Ignavibacteriaceae bacterium]